MTPDDQWVLANECEALAIAYAERAAYVKERYEYGYGEQAHNRAVKALNRIRKAVRKAFGYSTSSTVTF